MAECAIMKARQLLIAASCMELVAVGLVLGDGKVFLRTKLPADIFQPTQKVYINWDGSTEKLVIQTKYEGPAGEMVWIVPVPSKPRVEKGDPNLFERLSRRTRGHGILFTEFKTLFRYGTTSRGVDPVEWRRHIGDYDVVLLRPVGEEDVIEWLNTHGFGVATEAVPILEDYIRRQWWMVAARIHHDALTAITQDKLAQRLLDPLDMTFASERCVYPLRLTGLVAGPVEELIYIEGRTHFQPTGTPLDDWEIGVFGGPERIAPDGLTAWAAVDFAAQAGAGKTTKKDEQHLTKLRKTFKPSEMDMDLFFEALDYAKLISLGGTLRIGQAATQYGRHSDPAGIPHLLAILSAEELKKASPPAEERQGFPEAPTDYLSRGALRDQEARDRHLRGCIWALGEICIEHGCDDAVAETLVRCARNDNQLIRMEAYIALIKARLSELGPILLARLSQIVGGHIDPAAISTYDAEVVRAEADIAADWIERHGTRSEKETFAALLAQAISQLPPHVIATEQTGTDRWDNPTPAGWPRWLMQRAIRTRDSRVVSSLRGLRERIPDRSPIVSFLLKAEAACGSHEAISLAARRIAEDEGRIRRERTETPEGNIVRSRIPWRNRNQRFDTLEERIHRNREYAEELPLIAPETTDRIIRTTLSTHRLDDRYALYLLAQISEPQHPEKDLTLSLWEKADPAGQRLAVAVLWSWKDSDTLLTIRGSATQAEVRSEIETALTSLGALPG